jgi:glycerol-3-phosphate dehydrogenase (NAD(P)+)
VYLGDLIVTAYSEHSRNRRLGELIGKGHTVEKALEKMNMIAEGYYASKNFAVLKAECSVETPIMDSLYEILFKGKSASKTMQQLVQKLH